MLKRFSLNASFGACEGRRVERWRRWAQNSMRGRRTVGESSHTALPRLVCADEGREQVHLFLRGASAAGVLHELLRRSCARRNRGISTFRARRSQARAALAFRRTKPPCVIEGPDGANESGPDFEDAAGAFACAEVDAACFSPGLAELDAAGLAICREAQQSGRTSWKQPGALGWQPRESFLQCTFSAAWAGSRYAPGSLAGWRAACPWRKGCHPAPPGALLHGTGTRSASARAVPPPEHHYVRALSSRGRTSAGEAEQKGGQGAWAGPERTVELAGHVHGAARQDGGGGHAAVLVEHAQCADGVSAEAKARPRGLSSEGGSCSAAQVAQEEERGAGAGRLRAGPRAPHLADGRPDADPRVRRLHPFLEEQGHFHPPAAEEAAERLPQGVPLPLRQVPVRVLSRRGGRQR